MNKILLIDRLNPYDDSEERHEVFFMLGGMNDPKVEERLMDTLNESDIVEGNDIVLKYNGVGLNLRIQEIPEVTKRLVDNNIMIYGIYQIHSPDEASI